MIFSPKGEQGEGEKAENAVEGASNAKEIVCIESSFLTIRIDLQSIFSGTIFKGKKERPSMRASLRRIQSSCV